MSRFRRYEPMPARRRRRKPPAVILVGGGSGAPSSLLAASTDGAETRVGRPDECRDLLRKYSGHRVFSMTKLAVVLRALNPIFFVGHFWNGKLVGIDLDDGPRVYGTRQQFAGVDVSEAIEALERVDRFAAEFGVTVGSAGWMSEQFFRGSLSRPITFESSTGKRGMYGGRKGCPDPRPWTDCMYVDIGSAYPTAMAAEPTATSLVRSSGQSIAAPVGIALATVYVPFSDGWPPLFEPRRWGMDWRPGEYRGWWPLRDLRAASDWGASVIEVEQVFEGRGYVSPFDDWLAAMQAGRRLAGRAGTWMKLVSTSLWGMFCMAGVSKRVRWRPDGKTDLISRQIVEASAAAYVGGDITARVRERLQRELVGPLRPLYVDTDGGVIGAGDRIPEPSGDDGDPGVWSVRQMMREFDPRGPQAYRFVDYQDREEIVLAGWPKPSRVDLTNWSGSLFASTSNERFRRRYERTTTVVDDEGERVPIANQQVNQDTLPIGWKVIDAISR